jgi:hypothetical protein
MRDAGFYACMYVFVERRWSNIRLISKLGRRGGWIQ